MPSALLASLDELDRLLAAETVDLAELARLGEPTHLELLFQVRLATLIRRGPGAAPGRLLATAADAAAAGVLPLSAPGALRATLDELATRLREAGAWDRDAALWWSPLPAPARSESLWEDLRGDGGPAVPSRDELAAAFKGPRWLPLPSFLSASLTEAIWGELEDAGLELEPGGVGAEGRRTIRRSDEVRYVTGLEPSLLAAAPTLAALVQWLLARLADGLRVGERRVYPPQRAMLARYPAPSGGYAAHLDNPGGDGDDSGGEDNGRALTLVIYLNAPGHECAGGELALWAPGTSTADPPAAVLAPRSGSAVLFDSRAVAHRVGALAPGPARWALTLWLNDAAQRPMAPPPPRLGLTDALLPIAAPPLPAGTVLFHELDDARPSGRITVRTTRGARPRRVGLVATVYREGRRLDAWCAHHFGLGADHLVLVFDHLDEPEEAADATRLRDRFGDGRLTIWPGSRTAERWPRGDDVEELRRFAALGASSYAVASRQTLNAGVALAAARDDELGGAPLDWLVHLDADELLYLEGSGRGGATLGEQFAAASAAGLALLRYANHELLLPYDPASPRFKINPRLAAARLGPGGWRELVEHLAMAQTDPRPWFHGYFNGKSAVAVAAGAAAAGVHGWFLEGSRGPEAQRFLAGPSVLHFHFSSPESFRRKYLAIAASPTPAGGGPFELSPAEEATVELIRELERQGVDEETLARRLDEHHRRLTHFSADDVELLDEAGLVLRPRLGHVPDFG